MGFIMEYKDYVYSHPQYGSYTKGYILSKFQYSKYENRVERLFEAIYKDGVPVTIDGLLFSTTLELSILFLFILFEKDRSKFDECIQEINNIDMTRISQNSFVMTIAYHFSLLQKKETIELDLNLVLMLGIRLNQARLGFVAALCSLYHSTLIGISNANEVDDETRFILKKVFSLGFDIDYHPIMMCQQHHKALHSCSQVQYVNERYIDDCNYFCMVGRTILREYTLYLLDTSLFTMLLPLIQ